MSKPVDTRGEGDTTLGAILPGESDAIRTVIIKSSLRPDETELDFGATIKSADLPGPARIHPRPGGGAASTTVEQGETLIETRPTVRPPEAGRQGDEAVLPQGFELGTVVGRGGMGIVYRGRQLGLEREVAIKRVSTEGAAHETRRRHFLGEAVVTGGLQHPNIVPVHAVAEQSGGELYLAMKLVGGQTLAALLQADREPASMERLVHYVRTLLAVSNAIAFAHSRHVVHRDLKPENIMVGEFGEVLVMDWGIAVDVSETGGAPTPFSAVVSPKRTQDQIVGTPRYMAPEMAEGRGEDLGPWTDTYQLGAILHEILTGEAPHQGDNLLQVLHHAARSEPPAYPEGLPEELCRICRKAMSREIADRYRSVGELQADLRDFLDHRESRSISRRADDELEAWCARVEAEGVTPANRARVYGEIADVIGAYTQAAFLWAGNEGARAGETRARLRYAEVALQGGDLGLAQWAVAELDTDEARSLRTRIDEASRTRRRTVRATRRLGSVMK